MGRLMAKDYLVSFVDQLITYSHCEVKLSTSTVTRLFQIVLVFFRNIFFVAAF